MDFASHLAQSQQDCAYVGDYLLECEFHLNGSQMDEQRST